MKEIINAADFVQMIKSASAAVENHKQVLNEMNVFPVPDGDTGINMSLTLKAAAAALDKADTPETVGEASALAASALLRGARGNSGVILSLLFRGFSKACAGKGALNAPDFAGALEAGVEAAYRAVMKPAEGTILSVSRRAAAHAGLLAESECCVIEVLTGALGEAEAALADTVDQNPVLKKAGVVDAGGKGWVIILSAMLSALEGNPVVSGANTGIDEVSAGFAVGDEEITFTYCTEYIVNLSREGKKLDIPRLRALLESMGDSVVVVDDEDIIKVHLHTNTPDKALGEALRYGELVSIKIDNMREQHTQKVISDGGAPAPREPENRYGFVAVGAGDGVAGVYRDLGVGVVVQGGQTMNPSTEDILAAINSTPAATVFVLPNNKNIIMAAEQTVELVEGKTVVVIPTTSVPQGVSAMLAFDPDADEEQNREMMASAASGVHSGAITYAARDSEFDGHEIKEGEYLALSENKLCSSGPDLTAVSQALFDAMELLDKSFVTLFYGEGVSEEDAREMETRCRALAPDSEVMLIDGGQPVYYYMISAE